MVLITNKSRFKQTMVDLRGNP